MAGTISICKETTHMYCRKCGAQNEDAARQCALCGTDLTQPIPTQAYNASMGSAPIGVPATPAQPCPPNYLVWSILSTLFCCLIPGVVSIVYAAGVNSKYLTGDYTGAADSSKKAKTWAWVSFGLGLVVAVVYGAMFAIGGTSHFANPTPRQF